MRIAEIFRSIQGEGRLTGTASVFVRASGCNLRCGYCDTPYASWTPEGEDLAVDEILARVDQLRESQPPAFLKASSKKGDRHVAGPFPSNDAPASSEPVPFLSDALTAVDEASPGEVRHVVLTGGEPMLFAESIPLTARLRAEGWHITIETSGTLYLPVACDLMSISPKLSNSTPPPERDPRWTWRHTLGRHVPDVIRRLAAEYDCQWKFVIDAVDDCGEVEAYLAEFPEIERRQVMLMPQGVCAEALAQKAAWLEPYCAQQGFQYCPRRQIEWFGIARGM